MKWRAAVAFLVVAVLALAQVPNARAVPTPLAFTLDSFETYTSDLSLQSAWPVTLGAPTQTLSSVAHVGDKSMSFDYDVNDDPFINTVRHNYSTPIDLSQFTTLTIWVQGTANNGHDGFYLALWESGSLSPILDAGSDQQNIWADDQGWQRWDIDLTAASETLDAISALEFGVEILDLGSSGTGTVYFDEISLSNGLETIWLGNTTAWAEATNWDHGVPTTVSNARIPTAPAQGANFPQIISLGAAVHDLTIEPGATLDLGEHELAIGGTLSNYGTIQQLQAVGANTEVPFFMDGSNLGLVIQTNSFLLNSPNAPAQLTAGLGNTEVSVSGAQTCASSDDTVKRCYSVTPSNASSALVKITFYFAHDELNGQDCDALVVFNWDQGQWSTAGTVIARQCALAPYSVTVEDVGDFSPFVLAENSPVAIGLQDFEAVRTHSAVPFVVAAAFLLLGLAVWPELHLGDHIWRAARRLTGL